MSLPGHQECARVHRNKLAKAGKFMTLQFQSGHSRHEMIKKLAVFVALFGTILLLTTKHIDDEDYIIHNGDMSRYLMNGVFLKDALRDLPFKNPIEYAQNYFIQYPALSLGFHPPFLALAEIPFFTVMGVSVSSARWMMVSFMIIGSFAWYFLMRRAFNNSATFSILSGLLFATTPLFVEYSQIVMPDFPALCLVILSSLFYFAYLSRSKHRYLLLAIVSVLAAVTTKQLAVFLVPCLLFHFVIYRKEIWQKWKIRNILLWVIPSALIMSALCILTVRYSGMNVDWVVDGLFKPKFLKADKLLYPFNLLFTNFLLLPVSVFAVIGAAIAVFKIKNTYNLFFVLWVLFFYVQMTLLPSYIVRHYVYLIPPFYFFCFLTLERIKQTFILNACLALFVIAIVYQTHTSYYQKVEYNRGYEAAAKYIIEQSPTGSVLYCSEMDTGFFVFFIRKHCSEEKFFIIRGDKILSLGSFNHYVKELVQNKEDYYEAISSYNIEYIVVEKMYNAEFKASAFKLQEKELNAERGLFSLERSIPILSNRMSLKDAALNIYKYKKFDPDNFSDAPFEVELPIINHKIKSTVLP